MQTLRQTLERRAWLVVTLVLAGLQMGALYGSVFAAHQHGPVPVSAWRTLFYGLALVLPLIFGIFCRKEVAAAKATPYDSDDQTARTLWYICKVLGITLTAGCLLGVLGMLVNHDYATACAYIMLAAEAGTVTILSFVTSTHIIQFSRIR